MPVLGVFCSAVTQMVDVAFKYDLSAVFAVIARTGNLNGSDHRHKISLPLNPLTDRHSGQLIYFKLELSTVSPAFPITAPNLRLFYFNTPSVELR